MRVLVIGSGAREHALVRTLAADPDVEVLAAPGNPGIAQLAQTFPVDPADPRQVGELAGHVGADLVVVGPELPLVAGVGDELDARGIPCFGPTAKAAAIEGSKSFAKEVMAAASVPTAASRVFAAGEEAAAEEYLARGGGPYVVKCDGLAAGKGVTVTRDVDVARAALRSALGGPGDRVLIEDYLDGPELSLFALTDGREVRPMLPAQDFKRLRDGDEGPNTGGMGSYAPLPWAPAGLVEQVTERIIEPTVRELASRGVPFRGLLYAGLALTGTGPKVVEFNARFGDPETQSILPLLATPLAPLLLATAVGDLGAAPQLRWQDLASCTVVVAAAGYPDSPRRGDPIGDVAAAESIPGVQVNHAGTQLRGGELVSAGGRVLSVTATAPDLAAARRAAYEAVGRIRLPGAQVRRDIALAASGGGGG